MEPRGEASTFEVTAIDELAEGSRLRATPDVGLGLPETIAREDLKARLFGTPRAVEMLGRYRVLGVLGAGGMGVVLRARDDALDRVVALKLVRGEVAVETPESRARILREAQAMARLSHPNVVQIHDVGEVDGQVFVAMEYVRGQTLGEWIDALAPSLTPEQRRRVILEHFVAAGRGLAAAHGAGLVHRDFKPANVLVGEDGRVRVTDFGLARSAGEAPASEASTDAGWLHESMTRTGAVVGTPAYMSPQQIVGEAIDARSDVFSFTVALYEALHGVRPFRGAGAVELRESMLRGQVDAGDPTRVPPWMRAVLLRGLAFEPGARYPTMDALLEALSEDPELRRRRRRRIALGLVVAAAVVVVLALLGGSLREEWRRVRREEAAARTIADGERRIAGLREQGDEALAARLFEALVADPTVVDTDALAAAWLREGERRAGLAGGGAGAIAAFARGYVEAHDAAQTRAAMIGLAEALHAAGRHDELARLLQRLGHEHPDALDSPSVAALRLEAALASRALVDAAALAVDARARRAFEHLSRGTLLVTRVDDPRAFAIALGEGGTAGLLVQSRMNVESDVRIYRSPTEPAAATLRAPGLGLRVPVTAGPPLPYVVGKIEGRGENALFRLGGDLTLEELARWESDGWPLSSAALDLDRDGAPEVYVGEGPGSRDIVQVARRDGGWVARRVGGAVTMASDVDTLLPADLDRDGAVELVAAVGAWTAYDVRVLDLDASGLLRTRARDKLGFVHALAVLDRGDERVLVAAKNDRFPNARVFPPGRLFGEAAGLHFYRFDGAALQRVGHVASVGHRSPLVVDVDGDGRGDLVDNLDFGLAIHLQDERAGFTRFVLGHARLIGAFELDDDPAAELVLELVDDEGGVVEHSLWLAGVGDSPTPQRSARSARTGAVALREPALVERAQSVEVLADIGLGLEAARACEQLAPLAEDPTDRARLELRAAELYELAGRRAEATARFIAAAAADEVLAPAIEGALRGVMSEAQWRAATDALDRALARTQAGGRLAELRERVGSLAGALEREFRFDVPLAPEWVIHAPLALRRGAGDAALEVESRGDTVLLTMPVDYLGGALRVEIDATVDRLEWSGELALRLLPEGGGPSLLELRSCAIGGGGVVEHVTHAWVRTHGVDATLPASAARAPLREVSSCGVSPSADEIRCSVAYDGAEPFVMDMALASEPARPGRFELELAARGQSLTAVKAAIHGIRTTGLRPRASAASMSPTEVAARALVENEVTSALEDPSWSAAARAELLLRAGRQDEAQALLAGLLGGGASAPIEVLAGLRRRPDLFRPVLTRIDERRVFTHIRDAWRVARQAHPDDPRVDRELEDALIDLDRFVERRGDDGAADSEGDDVAVELLRWRAALRARRGARGGAGRDLTRALAIVRGPARASLRRHEQPILIDLAELAAVAGELVDAGELLRQAGEAGPRELVADLIVARPALHGLVGRE